MTPGPSNFPEDLQKSEVAYQFWNCSQGTESADGGWAKGSSPDGRGTFTYLENPKPIGKERGGAAPADPRLYGTLREPVMPIAAE